MISNSSCESTEEHRGHRYPAEMRLHCSGLTDCEVKTHEPHFYTVIRNVRCPGICGCNGNKDHGPGEHK